MRKILCRDVLYHTQNTLKGVVVLSQKMGIPGERIAPPYTAVTIPLHEGAYRIGQLLDGRDKWWHLNPDNREAFFDDWGFVNTEDGHDSWRPTSYENYEEVLHEAITEVSRDVETVLRKMSVAGLV